MGKISNMVLIEAGAILGFIAVLVLGHFVYSGALPWETDAKLISDQLPPAEVEVIVKNGEVYFRAMDSEDRSTKVAGTLEVNVMQVLSYTGPGNSIYQPVGKESIKINKDDYNLLYVNEFGKVRNVYVVDTGIRVPSLDKVYAVEMTFYPKGETYQLFKSQYCVGVGYL